MDRRVLALLGLLALVSLAGCPVDTTIDVAPQVDRVESSGDVHRLHVTVNPDLEYVDESVSDVRVHGYALDGELVCSAELGDVADRENSTLACETFPSLLVADTPDRGKTVEREDDSLLGDPPDYTIVTSASVYLGARNGSHQFDLDPLRLDRRSRFRVTDGRAVPTAEGLQTVQCRQWRHQQEGQNFSVLADAPWRAWELRDAGTDRSHRITVSNYTRHAERGRTDRFDVDPEGNTYAASDVPRRLRLTIQIDDYNLAPDNRDRFHDVVDGLSSAEVNASQNLTAALRGIEGRYGTYEDRRVTCGPIPPQQSGHRGEYVETYAVYDDSIYHVRLETEVTVSGNAFENVTAP